MEEEFLELIDALMDEAELFDEIEREDSFDESIDFTDYEELDHENS